MWLMRNKTDLKETILHHATELFAKNGYSATSIKQIAKAANCTTAALYYYFEDGKAHILRDVIQTYNVDRMQFLTEGTYETLEEFLTYLTQSTSQTISRSPGRMTWLLPEFDNLSAEEQSFIREQMHQIQQLVHQHVKQFVNEDDAIMISWLLLFTYMGFGQIFNKMGLGTDLDFGGKTFWKFFASTFSETK